MDEVPNKKTRSRKKLNSKNNMVMWGLILIAPTAIGLLVLNIVPFFQTLLMSFQNVSTFGTSTWNGLGNYTKLMNDAEFWQAFSNTLIYSAVQVPVTVILSTIAAVFLNNKIKGIEIYRTIYFLPMIAAPAAVAMVWRWMYNAEYGIINNILQTVGFSGEISWLTDPNIVLWSLIIVGVWSNVGFNMILLLAGLQEIPKTYYEAAEIDGAGTFRKFISVTLPLLTPQLFFVVVNSIIGSFQVFDTIFIMFDVMNPSLSNVQSLVYRFYNETFVLNNKGYGAAIVVMLVALILVVTLIQLVVQKKWVHYE